MESQREYPLIEGGLIQSVQLVDKLVRSAAGVKRAPSLPGHLIHFVVEGEAEQEVSGQQRQLVPGTVVWYHENEAVWTHIVKPPLVYYTVNFSAVGLAPPPFERRVWKAGAALGDRFQTLLDAWRDGGSPPITRHMRVLARLLELLMEVMPAASPAHHAGQATRLWWDIEAKVREDLSQPISIQALQSLARRSRHSIVCACRLAVGMAPMKRIKEIRLSYARGLVLYSHLPMTEISLRVGYSRVQELSRDYRRKFGITPTEDRQSGPDYRTERVSDG